MAFAQRIKKNGRSVTLMPKALDYAYACKDGVVKCFNTHGYSYDHFNQWTVVNNANNCQGTAMPDCTGQGAWWGTGPGSSKSPAGDTTAPYDYVLAVGQSNGRIDIYGVIVNNEETETYYPITKDQFRGMTGYNTVNLDPKTNRRVYRRKYLYGDALLTYNKNMYKVQQSSLNIAKEKFKLMGVNSLQYFVEILDFYGYNVKDNNDIAEVMTKYLSFRHPNYVEVNIDLANKVSQYYTRRLRNDGIVEKSLDLSGFNIGGIISGVMGWVAEMFQAGNEMATQMELTEWLNWFTNQMTIDYNDIVTIAAERGPKAAVDHIKQLEGTSWKDIQNYIANWCSSKGKPVPPVVKQVYDNFLAMKLELIKNAESSSSTPTYGNTTDPSVSTPSGSMGTIAIFAAIGIGALLLFRR